MTEYNLSTGHAGGAASDPFGQAPFAAGATAGAGDPFGSPTGTGQFSMEVDGNLMQMDNQMKEMQVCTVCLAFFIFRIYFYDFTASPSII